MTIYTPEIMETLEKKTAPILIVDDDKQMREGLAKYLSGEGFFVLHTASLEKALEILHRENISVIITYSLLNGVSGVHLLKKAKEIKPATERILIGSEAIPDNLKTYIEPLHVISHFEKSISSEKNIAQMVHDCFEKFKLGFEHQNMRSLLDKHHRDLAEAHSKLSAELELGSKIHQALLIDSPPTDLPGITLFTHSSASRDIDGDFITFLRPSHYVLDFALGDVMGKGLPSALIGTLVRSEVVHFGNASASTPSYTYDKTSGWKEDIPTIKEVLERIHQSTFQRLLDLEFYVSLFYGRLDLHAQTFSFIDCGFTKPIYYRNATKKAIFIQSSHFPLGVIQNHEYIPFEVQYEEGDFFLIYSDGIIEAKSPTGELFGEERLGKLVESEEGQNPERIIPLIRSSISKFTEQEGLDDDLTLVVLKINEYAPRLPPKSQIAKFNSTLSQLQAVRRLTEELCHPIPKHAKHLSSLLQVVMDEVFTNIVLHGYKEKTGQPICIHAQYFKDTIMIEISDQGISLNPHEIPETNLFGDKDHGYGWYLIRQLIDKVVYQPKKTKNGWNHLQLFKNYSHKQGDIMELTSTEQNHLLIVRLESDSLDAKHIPEFKEKVMKLIFEKRPEGIVFDLEPLQFIDSSGLGAFLSLLRKLNTHGSTLCFAKMSKPVKTIFELVSMQKIFDCYDTVNDAVEKLQKK